MNRWNELVNEEETHSHRALMFELAEARLGARSAGAPVGWKRLFTGARLLPVSAAIGLATAAVFVPLVVSRFFFGKTDQIIGEGASGQFEVVLALENQDLLKEASLLNNLDLFEDWEVLRDWDENHG